MELHMNLESLEFISGLGGAKMAIMECRCLWRAKGEVSDEIIMMSQQPGFEF